MTEARILRIGNAGGYWGDDPYALRRQVTGSLQLDYISIDFLAEITMSILQKQKEKNPQAGYARDFVVQVAPLLPILKEKGTRIITNAGGVNPQACAQALYREAKAQGVSLRIAIVEGDDVRERLAEFVTDGESLTNMDDDRAFSEVASRVLSANAYFGAKPVVRALQHDPDIILCGRVTDTGITLAALLHEFGWAEDDYDRLAHGIVAGHIIECGAQATGGNFTDWKKVKRFDDIGFPIVEFSHSGGFVVTKHPECGGMVSDQTIREQLLYEMGEPESYITPDVIADFSTIEIEDLGSNRVAISGVRGRPPTDFLKLSVSYRDGYKSSGTLIISGPDAREKAECFAEIFWTKLEKELKRLGLGMVAHTQTEYVGDDATHGPLSPSGIAHEILLRFAARDADEKKLGVFRKILPSLILSGPSGVAVTGGAPIISEIVSYWPALVHQSRCPASYRILDLDPSKDELLEGPGEQGIQWTETAGIAEKQTEDPDFEATNQVSKGSRGQEVPLYVIAHARSGDKGDTANIGLIGRSERAYSFLYDHVSARVVKALFVGVCHGRVRRYSVPNLWALNFLLEHSLDGGGTMSLKLDAQGKTLSQALLRHRLWVPEEVLDSIDVLHSAKIGELSS